MVSPQKIKFNGVNSTELNPLEIILDVSFDSDNGTTSAYLNRSAVASESHDGRYHNTARYKYDELFSPQFTIVKKDFSDFTQGEVRKVLKYLTSTDKPALLEVYYNGTTVDWACIGGWTNIETYKLANNRTVGIVAQFEAVTPYAMSALYGYDSSGEIKMYDITEDDSATMYYWESTLVSGLDVPTYLLTSTNTLAVGTNVYSSSAAIDSNVINVNTPFYGTIDRVDDDGYIISGVKFTVEPLGTRVKKKYKNKIFIDINTDDNKPIFPKITIKQQGTVVPVTPDTVYTNTSDIVPNTVYFNGTTYYWKSEEIINNETKPNYEWDIVEIDAAYAAGSIIEKNKIYYYKTSKKYYWIEPYYFHTQTGGNPPNLSTTSVRISNKHTDFFNNTKPLPAVVIKNNTSSEKIVLDGANKIVSTDSTKRIFGDDFNWQWLELYDGKNEITIEGNCRISFEWREIRKIGEF